MKFSVITVCLNAGNDLLLTVNSTLNQTFLDYEIIIKDAFSKDGSLEKVPKDKRIKIIQSKDSGIYDAMNQGIRQSKGDYLIFMNAGDLFYDNEVLARLEAKILADPCEMYYGKSYCADLKMVRNYPSNIDKYFCYRSMICHQATIYRRDMLLSRNYDTEFKVSADKDRLMFAIIKEKIKPQYVPIIISRYKGQGFSDSLRGKKINTAENKRLVKRYYTISERIQYRVKYLLTLPHVRRLLIKNKKINIIYNKLIGLIYRT